MRRSLLVVGLFGAMLGGALLAACYATPTGEADCSIHCQSECPGELVCSNNLCTTDGNTCGSGSQTIPGDVAAFGVGARSACALTLGGKLMCWGANDDGQVGAAPGSAVVTAPVAVGDPSLTWTALAVGADHACAIHDGAVECWGNNKDGEVKGTAGGSSAAPTTVTFMTSVPPYTQLATGAQSSCAIGGAVASSSATAMPGDLTNVWCWGAQDGIGYPAEIEAATPLPDNEMFTALSAGVYHVCGITTAGGVACWGHDDTGELDGSTAGDTTPMPPTPVPLPAGTHALQVAAGDGRTCAILTSSTDPTTTTGELWCWGRNDDHVLDGTNAGVVAVEQIADGEDWSAIATGPTFACGVRAGMARCWGTSLVGGLGDGIWVGSAVAADGAMDQFPAAAVAIAGRDQNESNDNDDLACALTADHHLECWGDNRRGELANGGATEATVPISVPAPGGSTWVHVWSGDWQTCGQTADDKLWCWGGDMNGQVSATATPGGSAAGPCTIGTPCDVAAITAAPIAAPTALLGHDDVVTGDEFTCVYSGGAIRCWGDTSRLGGGSGYGPFVVPAPTNGWAGLTGGDQAACGRDGSDRLSCWGQIADVPVATPAQTTNSAQMVTQEFGEYVACGLESTGTRVCYGLDYQGEIGDDGSSGNFVPALPFTDESAYTQLANAYTHACAIQNQNVLCWGTNYNGEAGLDDTNPATPLFAAMPTKVADENDTPLAGCTMVSLSIANSCAICNGAPTCWGSRLDAADGRAADDFSAEWSATPVVVPAGHTWTEIATGYRRSCALADDTGGATPMIACWGTGVHGELGNGAVGSCTPIVIDIP